MATDPMGVIFDMDGVLVDSYEAHFESWRAAGERHGLHMTEPQFRQTFGRTSRDIIAFLWPGRFPDNKAADVFDEEKEAAYRGLIHAHFPEMPGATAMLRALKTAGFRLAVGSSGPPENVALCVSKLDPWKDLFAATVSRSDITRGKPDPQVFLVAASRLGVSPDRCAVIEDAPAGLQAAKAAGMTPVALASGTAPVPVLQSLSRHVALALSELTPTFLADLIQGR
jgi:beta-phosphoglucomutase